MTLQKSLLKWFSKHARPLPWRKKYSPYEVWVSEIMLQQTQVETALPFYERWMKVFPTIESLAKSQEEKVLKLWQGLGYYSRARNIHASAKQIMAEHGGEFPSDYHSILALKGIGRYSAGAISSIAFNQDKPIVDGNVLRVLSRVFTIQKPIDKNKEDFWKLQESLIPSGQARYFNQALMELGALVCTSQNPQCSLCPIQKNCKASATNTVLDYPIKIGKKKMVRIEAAAVIFENSGKFFIHKRPLGEIMGGLWEFPEWKLTKDKKMTLNQIEKSVFEILKLKTNLKINELNFIGIIKRNYTHHLESLYLFKISLPKPSKILFQNNWPSKWISKNEFKNFPFSSAHAKIAKKLQ